MSNNNPKAKGNKRSLKDEQKLVNDKYLERNIQIEISREFTVKKKNNDNNKKR